MNKPKRGRPAKAPGEKREVFALRLTANERAAIERAAETSGLAVSDWARTALLAATETRIRILI